MTVDEGGLKEKSEEEEEIVIHEKQEDPVAFHEFNPREKEEIEQVNDLIEHYNCAIEGCRSVEEFECLNRIEEGTYGVVYRAKDKKTNEYVALKRLKMEKEREGFPITSLREIDTLLKSQHPNVVTVRVSAEISH